MLTRTHRSLLIGLVAFVSATALGAACNAPPSPRIDSPSNGSFEASGSVTVTGRVIGTLSQVANVTVNGVSVLPLGGIGQYSRTVTLDTAAVFNPIVVEVTRTDGRKVRDRVTVIAGQSVADGAVSEMGVGMRLNDTGLDAIEPLLGDLVDLDLATLLPVNTVLINNQCMIDTIFGCTGRATVRVINPPPSISGFGIGIDSLTNVVDGDISVYNMAVDVDIDGSGLVPDCGLHLTAAQTNIDGDYALSADSVDPSNVDVNQTGPVGVGFVSFNQEYTYGTCTWPIIGDIIQLIIGDIEPTVVAGLAGFLADPDGGGPQDAPVADAIEVALAGISIAGPIGEAIGVTLEAPLYDVYEDTAGITFDSDARVTALMPDPNAPDLTASYHVPETFPTFGANTPVGSQPYGLSLAISSSAFNQLLKAETESGLLRTSIMELDFGFGPVPLTAGNLATFVPALAAIDPDTDLRIDLAPTLAPVVTGQDGPNAEIGDLRIGHLLATLVVADTGATLLSVVVDVEVGLDITFAAGHLAFTLGTLTTNDLALTILKNPLNANEAQLISVLLFLLPDLLPTLADSLGSFPIPSFFGLNLSPVEISKVGGYMSLYANLTPAP
jgi:hypothetical protein